MVMYLKNSDFLELSSLGWSLFSYRYGEIVFAISTPPTPKWFFFKILLKFHPFYRSAIVPQSPSSREDYDKIGIIMMITKYFY